MKIAIISDIHSNFEALTRAFEVIDASNIDEIICLGDVVGYGANPNECVDMIKERCSIVLKGNHDEAVVKTERGKEFNKLARSAIEWTHNELRNENLDYLSTLPFLSRKNGLLFVHSSPMDPESWHYIITVAHAANLFSSFDESICFIGHTHIPGIFNPKKKALSITKDDRYIINVGSVGQPRDGNPMLSFGILDTDVWEFKIIRKAYDIGTASAKIFEKGLPHELGLRLLYGH
jgi:predicted phosphodiesterase